MRKLYSTTANLLEAGRHLPMTRFLGVAAILLFPMCTSARAELPGGSLRVGQIYEITSTQDSSDQTGDESSGSSFDKDTIIERILAVRSDGVEIEYDFPAEASAEERTQSWQFPVRVFRPKHGPSQLLNRGELETRVDAWLRTAKLTRAACGHWIFTWNAFQIECDPQSVIKTIEGFDPDVPELREGVLYKEPEALDPAPLMKETDEAGRTIFTAQMRIDPGVVRQARAESDVVVGEITNKPVTLESALRERSKEAISGTISVSFYVDRDGVVRRRTKVTKLETAQPGGPSEIKTTTEVLARRLLSGS